MTKPYFLDDITVCGVPIPSRLQGGVTLPVLTYVLLVDHIREHGPDAISPSLNSVGRELGVAGNAAGVAVKRLIDLGVIGRIRPGTTAQGVIYTIPDPNVLRGMS
jgi:DNA-binding transcriptional regulator PaaX